MNIIDENCLEDFCMIVQNVLFTIVQFCFKYPVDSYNEYSADAIELEEIRIQQELSDNNDIDDLPLRGCIATPFEDLPLRGCDATTSTVLPIQNCNPKPNRLSPIDYEFM
jgi:hypothetical protein